jgi:hypothetical protein
MDHWLYENLFVFILASVSLLDLARRLSTRLHAAIVSLPLRCYLGLARHLTFRSELKTCKSPRK